MAELLSAGVFIEEVPSSVQVIQPVSTSNLGIVGWTPKGPDNEATLVTSFEDFTRKFGDIVKESFMGLTMAAYFANGGRRAFVVRVVPSDAVASDSNIRSQTRDQEIRTGDGSTNAWTATAGVSTLKDNAGASPIVAESVSLRWRGSASAVSAETAKQRDGTTDLATSTSGGSIYYEGMIDPSVLVSFRERMHRVVPGTVTISWDAAAKSIDITDTTDVAEGSSSDGTAIIDHRSGRFSFVAAATPTTTGDVTVDYTPAIGDRGDRAKLTLAGVDRNVFIIADSIGVAGNDFTLEVLAAGVPASPSAAFASGSTTAIQVTLGATGSNNTAANIATAIDGLTGVSAAASASGGTVFSTTSGPTAFAGGRDATAYFEVIDDGAGVLEEVAVGLTGTGTINYTTGAYSFTTSGSAITLVTAVSAGGYTSVTYSSTPHDEAPILADYQIDAWELNPISAGAWGNKLRTKIVGNSDFYDASTASFSRFNMNVLLQNSSGTYDVMETFEEMNFEDTDSSEFWADVVNELSDLISVEEPGGNEPPLQLQGISRTNVLAGGDEASGTRNITDTLTNAPLQPRTISITFEDTDGNSMEITDDGNGNLIGDIDSTGVNTINYDTGALDVTVSDAINGRSLVVCAYYSAPEEETHTEDFGDEDLGYEVGDDGTFTSATYGRDQITDPDLSSDFLGMYALSKVDELMQVVIPDFVGDEVIAGDMIDYADARALQPSGADRFLILQPPMGSDAQEAVDWFRFTLNRTTIHAALYWPWVRVADPLANGRPLTMPAVGHVAGIYARTDSTKNVGKSPGGTVDGKLNFLLGLEREPITQGERDFVYPNKVNPLVSGPQTGLAVWGVRTMASPSLSEWRYINARRLFNFLEKSIFNATHWVVFENNGPALWTRIAAQLNGFLTALHNDGYFAGRSPAESFFVIVDSSNNTSESINLGQVVVDVGVAPNKPAEYLRIRMTQVSL